MMIKNLTLEKLKQIAISCEAVIKQKPLGFAFHRKLSEISQICEERIEFDIALCDLIERTKGLRGTPDIDVESLKQEERDILSAPVTDMEIDPVSIPFDEDFASKFKDDNVTVVLRNNVYNIDPYSAFHYLIKVGIIQLN